MKKDIEELYGNIGKNIFNKMPDKWNEAVVYVELYGDAGNFKGEFRQNSRTEYFEVYDDALDDFEDIQSIMKRDGLNDWNRAKFTLYPDGNFNIDFEWDQELADEIERLS